MGGKESKSIEHSQEGLKNFKHNFEFIKTENDPRFGKIEVHQERTSGKYIGVKNVASEDAAELNILKDELNYRINMVHPHIARIIGYTQEDEENMCGRNKVLSIYTEWYEHDLDLEIQERFGKKVTFSSYQRTTLLSKNFGISQVLWFLQVLSFKQTLYIMGISDL